jgi:hypothetical protein
MSYTKLSNSILTSTLWMEDEHTRLVWVTMLAMKDRHGEVMGSIPGLANVARVPVESCRAAIAKFLAPDPDSRTKDHEGRRIEAITGGWAILNHGLYRDLDSDQDRRRKDAERQQRARNKRKAETSQRDGVTNHTSSAMQISDADADAKTDTERERERPARALSRKEQQRQFLEGMGAITWKDGACIMSEWAAETKGLKAERIAEFFKEAVPGIQWPSQFKAWRAAKATY